MEPLETIHIPSEKLHLFIKEVLLKAGVREDVARCVTEGLIQTSLRGVDSHGIRLLPHYVRALKGGRINPHPHYAFQHTSPSTGLFDGDHTFGHAAGMEATKKAILLAKEAGSGHVAVYHSTHFGAAAYYGLEIAKHDMIGFCFSNTDALIKSTGGKRPFFGNNPICITVPCKDEEPFCLDMATSSLTFNKVKQFEQEGVKLSGGVGFDKNGLETTNPKEITMLSPIGGYKGYGLSMALEILCSLLTGMPYGRNISKMFDAPLSEKRFLGHFIMALRIDCFQPLDIFKERFSQMIQELRGEPKMDATIPIQIPGDPEKKIFEVRRREGIPIPEKEYLILQSLGSEYEIVL